MTKEHETKSKHLGFGGSASSIIVIFYDIDYGLLKDWIQWLYNSDNMNMILSNLIQLYIAISLLSNLIKSNQIKSNKLNQIIKPE